MVTLVNIFGNYLNKKILFINKNTLYVRFLHRSHADTILKQYFGDDVPSVDELVANTSLLFVNTHYSLSGSKPQSPALIEVGGIHIQEPKPLKPVSIWFYFLYLKKHRQITKFKILHHEYINRTSKKFWITQKMVSF